jgi:L-asparagine transporter-like permease
MDGRSIAIFLLLNVALGGAAAASAGRALAQSWRPAWQAIAYMGALGAFIRFLHYALFGERLLTPAGFAVDWIVALAFAGAGFVVTRRRQMRRQYGWRRAVDR